MQSDSISKQYLREEISKDMQKVYDIFKTCDEKGLCKPRIVCAANKCSVTGTMLIGARHWDIHMRNQYDVRQSSRKVDVDIYCVSDEIQGFIDQHGNFYTREEAWLIAVENNQIIRRVGGDYQNGISRLYSENIY